MAVFLLVSLILMVYKFQLILSCKLQGGIFVLCGLKSGVLLYKLILDLEIVCVEELIL